MIWIIALVVIAFVAGCAIGATFGLAVPHRRRVSLVSTLSRVEERRLSIPTVRR